KRVNDPVRWLVYGLIVLFISTFSFFQLKSWKEAFFFTAGIIASFLLLTLMAQSLMWMVRRFFPVSWSYLWRQGLANLYRPNNQTVILIVSIGLGTAFICTLFFIQGILLSRVTVSASGNQPNMVLFDIQSQQKDKLINMARQQGLVVKATVPVVNMRLEKLNSYSAASLVQDSSRDMYGGIFIREYRVTYRDSTTCS
ncbi:MAG: ABC transporter permease, partial [Chitinophagaceae bacterium]